MQKEGVLKSGMSLVRKDGRLTLVSGDVELYGDFSHMLPRLKYNNLTHEMLVKATRFKHDHSVDRLTAVDATAGLGEDSLLLAASGFEVDLYEHNPVTALLLEDALERASADPALADIVSYMHFHSGDSLEALRGMTKSPDVVFLDPMFPERQKSNRVKKKLGMLQQIEIPCADEKEMLEAALAAGPRRIVIKRPVKGPYLAGRKPSYSISGSVIRYDCIVL